MTNTTIPSANDSGLNLDHLEALARAATPGPWGLAKVADRSIEHLCPVDRDRLSLLTVVYEGETPYGAVYRDEDANFVAAIHPEQVLALIALARRAQPASEATQTACTVPPEGWYCTRAPGHDGPCAAWPVAQQDAAPSNSPEIPDGSTSAPGTPEAPQPPFPVSDEEMAALRRFWECASDGEGYDVEKTMMQRLAEMGLVQRKSGAYYMVTEFGLYVLREYTIPRAAQLDGGQEGSAT